MTSTLDLFGGDDPAQHGRVALGTQSVVLRGFALPAVDALLAGVDDVIAQAPFRHMETPGGYTMSVALTNCGELGWTTDARGYRYSRIDPLSGQPWPAMPQTFRQLAEDAAREAGFADFAPDACLVNRYAPGSRLSLHQDRNERDYGAPIVSVSLGMPAMFLFGGDDRADRAARVPLFHGDVVVWGGVDRLRFHGVMPLKDLPHPRLGSQRINFTIRKAG
ncbi:Alpha-ketoglutarate-dependent dioxygenase AlkB [Achromobacter mucicolens]|uniref:DNA oxidative demethylase AlkB n=1 Tax=Achromobacter mucicolens TaxID=1389922 RepID=UPI0012669B64|nr:DNA oxidative demethylase AlkB [Achromobacter mucicolens]CAB3818462.1 Alpha-ketoglutarate-dependent dioxygenase AlkB [Achromobacter mucicolens]